MAFKRFNARPTSTTSSSSTPFALVVLNLTLRFLQFVFALAVIGLYAQGIKSDHDSHHHANYNWSYAVVVATLAAITTIIYALPKLKSYWGFGWDWCLFILWVAVFGVFGNKYIHAHNPGHDSTISRMKSAVWIDLVNMLLWLVTAVMATVAFFSLRGGKSLHTGRATV